jgi:3-phenylpropionate/trans-cinnamate dioxygenase ferredoxin reductase subunit
MNRGDLRVLAEPVVVIGGGLATVCFIDELRRDGFFGHILAILGETELPYDRPPLSKGFLQDPVCPPVWLDIEGVGDTEWLLGSPARSLDTGARQVGLQDVGC